MPMEQFLMAPPKPPIACPLKVGERNHIVVVLQVRAHEVLSEVRPALHRQRERAFRVHDVDLGDGGEAMVSSCLQMTIGGAATPAVRGVALHDGGA